MTRIWCRCLRALLKGLKAGKLELEAALQEKEDELKQTQALAVLNDKRATHVRFGFERDLLLCLEASLKAELDASLKDSDSKLTEAVAALQLLEAWDKEWRWPHESTGIILNRRFL